jgi:hypothetical protein
MISEAMGEFSPMGGIKLRPEASIYEPTLTEMLEKSGLNCYINVVSRRFGAAGLSGLGGLGGGFDQFYRGLAFLFLSIVCFAGGGGLNLWRNGAHVTD